MVSIDIFDYSNTLVCPLYSSENELSGGAADVVITFQRNGAKTLSFTLPDTMIDDSGQNVENFRCEYLKADYLIRVYDSDCRLDGDDTDFFIISEPKIVHQNMSATRTVTCDHVSALLKTKNLGLVFSDTEGNNVGKAEEILKTILEGTNWSIRTIDGELDVDTFFEKHRYIDYNDPESVDKNIKRRTLVASERTGAFNLISKLCDLFEARAIYHGKDRTVSMHLMNPFSKEDNVKTIASKADTIYELHYGKNVKTITKTLNTENLTTRLYAYGAYGDYVNGYCNIDEVSHNEWAFDIGIDLVEGSEYTFETMDNMYIKRRRYFTAPFDISSGTRLLWSELDPASMMYIWVESKNTAIKVYEKQQSMVATDISTPVARIEKQNYFPCLMDFSYYDEIGLFKDEHLQQLAKYQRESPDALKLVDDRTTKMAEDNVILYETIGANDFVKLAGPDDKGKNGPTFSFTRKVYFDIPKNYLTIDFTGLDYTSEYMKKEKDWFTWRPVTDGFKKDGSPLNAEASCVYIIRPVSAELMTHECYYIMEGDRKSGQIIVSCTDEVHDLNYFNGSRVYVFSRLSTNGYLGAIEIALKGIVQTMESETKYVRTTHPVHILNESKPDPDKASGTDAYAWAWRYRYTDGKEMRSLKFSLASLYNGEWYPVMWGRIMPENRPGTWFYNWATKKLYFSYPEEHTTEEGIPLYGYWVEINDIDSNSSISSMVNSFAVVIKNCLEYNAKMFGIYEKYQYKVNMSFNYETPAMIKGNYAWLSPDDDYFLFETEKEINNGTVLTFDTKTLLTSHDNLDNPYTTHKVGFDSVTYMPVNAAIGKPVTQDTWLNDGREEPTTLYSTSGFIPVYNDAAYIVNASTGYVALYDQFNNYIETHIFSSGIFDTRCEKPNKKTMYVRLVIMNSMMSDLSNLSVTIDGFINQKIKASYEEQLPQPSWAPSYAVRSQHVNLAYDLETIEWEGHYCTNGIPVSFGHMYCINHGTYNISFYDADENLVGSYNPNYPTSMYSYFNVPYGATHCTVCRLTNSPLDVHLSGPDRIFALEDELYEVLAEPYITDGIEKNIKKGLIPLLTTFAETADTVYIDDYNAVKEAQAVVDDKLQKFVDATGYMYREGWMQKNDYVDGDEQKLYDDGLETLREIAWPEEKYDISFINTDAVPNWNDVINPVITAASAIHIIDDDIGISKWAFVDKLAWCVDQPWKTQLQVNTNLSTITSHTFADVMQHIAEVSNTMSGKDALYKRAAYLNNYGEYLADNLEGQISLDKVKLTGVASTLTQDDNGNFVLEAVDGSSAIIISSAGIGVATSRNEDGDWNWRTCTTGEGISADLITSGTLRASLIQAGLITTEMLAAPVGSELNVYSNKSVRLVADEQIFDKGFSNGVNLMRAAANGWYSTNQTIDLNYIEVPKERSTDKIVFRVNLKTTSSQARADLIIIDDGKQTTVQGNVIDVGNREGGWSSATATLASTVEMVIARITIIDGRNDRVDYSSPKVELGKIPTLFTFNPDDTETDTVGLSRAVLEVNPRFISQSVTSETIYSNHENLYSEMFDGTNLISKNRFHGFTVPADTTLGFTTISHATYEGDYVVSFLAKSEEAGSLFVAMCNKASMQSLPGQPFELRMEAGYLYRVVYHTSFEGIPEEPVCIFTSEKAVTISNFMVEHSLIASAWCASADSNTKNGENLLINGGFTYYVDGPVPHYEATSDNVKCIVDENGSGVIDDTSGWSKQGYIFDQSKLFGFVIGEKINNDISWDTGELQESGVKKDLINLSDYVDKSVNTLVIAYTATETGVILQDPCINAVHTPIAVEPGAYYSLSMYVSGLGLSSILVNIQVADGEYINKSITEITQGDSLEKYVRIDIPFEAVSDTVQIFIHGFINMSDPIVPPPVLFVANCKLEYGMYSTDYSSSPLDDGMTGDTIANLLKRVSKAEIKIEDDAIIQTVTRSDTYKNGMTEIAKSISKLEADRLYTEFRTQGLDERLTWFVQNQDGLSIGKSDSKTTMQLSNSKLSFLNNATEVAYIGESGMMVSKASFTNSFNLGTSTPLTVFLCSDGGINFGWSQ